MTVFRRAFLFIPGVILCYFVFCMVGFFPARDLSPVLQETAPIPEVFPPEPSLPAHDFSQETGQWCQLLGKRLYSVEAEFCQRQNFRPSGYHSAQGHPLMSTDVPPRLPMENQARPIRILLIGGIHGDELSSVSIVFRWMRYLEDKEAQECHWRILPLANPDGLFAKPSRRTNGNGVDLNRNFPTQDWEEKALSYWKQNTQGDPRRYPGDKPQSEPETQWMLSEMKRFEPDVIVSIHAPYGILDYDGPPKNLPSRFGHLNLSQLGIYPGSLGNFGSLLKDIPIITIELPHATTMPSLHEQRQIWNDMLDWIRRNIEAKPPVQKPSPPFAR